MDKFLNEFLALFSGWLGILILVFFVVLSILWIILPFAVFGANDKLDKLLFEAKSTNSLIQKLINELKHLGNISPSESKRNQNQPSLKVSSSANKNAVEIDTAAPRSTGTKTCPSCQAINAGYAVSCFQCRESFES
jgi:predicted PurR-regulated permease PerM